MLVDIDILKFLIRRLILFFLILALDAFCLVEIFEFLQNRTNELNMKLDFHTVLGKKYKPRAQNINKNNQKEKTKNESVEDFEEKELILNEKPIKPSELKLVVDNMLHGLGKELRRCGVDTVMIDNNQEHSDIARVVFIEF
jgi:hypothetical protein